MMLAAQVIDLNVCAFEAIEKMSHDDERQESDSSVLADGTVLLADAMFATRIRPTVALECATAGVYSLALDTTLYHDDSIGEMFDGVARLVDYVGPYVSQPFAAHFARAVAL